MSKNHLTSAAVEKLIKEGKIRGVTDKVCTNAKNRKSPKKQRKTSEGELFIAMVLDELGIEYIPQFCFDWPKSERRFDFLLLPKSKKILLEYDGLVHGGRGGHQTPARYTDNMNKRNEAAKAGYTVFAYTDINKEQMIKDLKEFYYSSKQ